MLLMMVVAVDGDGDCMETLKAYIYIYSLVERTIHPYHAIHFYCHIHR